MESVSTVDLQLLEEALNLTPDTKFIKANHSFEFDETADTLDTLSFSRMLHFTNMRGIPNVFCGKSCFSTN